MTEPGPGRYEIRKEKGSPRGDLFELEQKTYYHVVDRHSEEIIMTFESLMEASLSRESGAWDDYEFTGVREVIISADEQSVTVRYFDGLEETLPLSWVRRTGPCVRLTRTLTWAIILGGCKGLEGRLQGARWQTAWTGRARSRSVLIERPTLRRWAGSLPIPSASSTSRR